MDRPHSPWAFAREFWRRDCVMMPFTLLSVATYLGVRLDQRWIPHDEGLLAQAAERVLRGEWPHRDFDDPYTGGLALLHAGALRGLGVNLLSLRWPLLVTSVGFAAVLYRIGRRVASPSLASFVTWLGIAWGMPNYFSPLPSWYNLMLAAGGTLCLMRYIERERKVDLVLAGLLGGLSFLVKSIGLYYVAAGLLTLVYLTSLECDRPDAASGSRFEGWVVRMALASLGVLLASMLRVGASVMDRLHFTMPGLLLIGVLFVYDYRLARKGRQLSARRLLDRCLPFLGGVVLPIAMFLVPYVASHSLGQLWYGVFVAPQRRLVGVTSALPALPSLMAALPYLGLIASPVVAMAPKDRPRLLALLNSLALLLLWLGSSKVVYRLVWLSARPLVPIAVVACTLVLTTSARTQLSAVRRAQLFASVAVCAFVSLVQFPYAYGIYFFYTAPLLVLSMLFVIASQPSAPRRIWLIVGTFHLGFALLWLNSGHLRRLGTGYVPDRSDTRLSLPRGGLKVEAAFSEIYTRLTREVQAHSPPGAYIYAAPDSPEVYFLTGRRNPTRTFYDLFDRDFYAVPGQRARRILDALERRQVDVVVIHRHPEFSGPPEPALMQALLERYPHATAIAPLFELRFRDPHRSASRARTIDRSGYDSWH